MKSGHENRVFRESLAVVFRESLAVKCDTQVCDLPVLMEQGAKVSANYLTIRSFQIGQAQGLQWINDLEETDLEIVEKLIRDRLKVEKGYLAERAVSTSIIKEKLNGICDSPSSVIVDYIYSIYMELEKRVGEEREATSFNGPCDSLLDVKSLGLVSVLHWMLDDI